jgi:hypothetical protein
VTPILPFNSAIISFFIFSDQHQQKVMPGHPDITSRKSNYIPITAGVPFWQMRKLFVFLRLD